MKKTGMMLLCIMLTGMIFTGCGDKENELVTKLHFRILRK